MTDLVETAVSPTPALTDNEFVPLPVPEGDIGGELLRTLSKGLYTYPLHCIREYVQNGVDAGAKTITIKITGNSVLIHDDGNGMNLAELIEARRVGVSRKDISTDVGFRGIGIYSGFDLCNRLLITTKKRGDARAYVLEFDFGGMKERLDAAKLRRAPQTPLTDLLYSYSRFAQEPDDEASHYTTVQLEDISDVHIRQLSERAELRRYILKSLPIDFDPLLEHRNAINQALADHVPGYNAVTVVLESDTAPRETVVKPRIPHLGAPSFGAIRDRKGKQVAFYWACLRKPRHDQPSEDGKPITKGKIPDEFADYRGFVYKMRGFTIGNNTKLQSVFKKGNSGLYWWYMGEVYVTDPEVVPNTARDDFEVSPAQRSMEVEAWSALKTLEDQASKYQEQARATEKFSERLHDLERLEPAFTDGAYDPLSTYSELDQFIRELRSQRSKLPEDRAEWGRDILSRLEHLKTGVKRDMDRTGTSQRRAREGAGTAPVRERSGAWTGNAGSSTEAPSRNGAGASIQAKGESADGQATSTERLEAKRLADLIENAGWALAPDCARLVDLIDRAITDTVGGGTVYHQAILANLEAKLAAELT